MTAENAHGLSDRDTDPHAGQPRLLVGAEQTVDPSTGDPDPHVPLIRVRETVQLFEQMGAEVTFESYPGRPHMVLSEEIEHAARLLA